MSEHEDKALTFAEYIRSEFKWLAVVSAVGAVAIVGALFVLNRREEDR